MEVYLQHFGQGGTVEPKFLMINRGTTQIMNAADTLGEALA